MQKRIFDSIFGDGHLDIRFRKCFGDLLYSQPSRPSPDPRVSASMAFATKVLQLRVRSVDSDKRWPSEISEVDIFLSVFNRLCRRRLPEAALLDVITLGLKLLEAKPELLSAFRSRDIWSKLINRWKKAPELYEDVLAIALRSELGGSQTTFAQDFSEASKTLEETPELRWQLLKQYCLHVPKNGIDLDSSNDFSPLANQPWSVKIFDQLSKEQAIRLLNGLRRANPKYSFLDHWKGSIGTTILSNAHVLSRQNFNVELLLTILQRNSEEIQRKSENCVAELRHDSSIAKDPLHRAKLAQAASAYAIASGNIDLYRETVMWQQRFVRDPDTRKVIFGWDAVMTSEGIELLSGIPQPLPEDMTLAKVASSVEQANEILKTFHVIICEAKREPSFCESDWTGVNALFRAAVCHRVARMKDLRSCLRGPEADAYASIWGSTLNIIGEVRVDFHDGDYDAIKTLFATIHPTDLASAAKAMLDSGNEKRKNQDRHSGHDTIERLSYEALMCLVRSEMPELARPLVLQTILDRPDASSWHRQFLSISFLSRLTAEDARQLVVAFATSIGEKLEEQSYVKVGEVLPSKSTQPPSLVKVTTVKYLAHILYKAEFVSPDSAVKILTELIKVATHRDVVLVTLKSLLGLLTDMCSSTNEKWRYNISVERTMDALDAVIPVVGSVNELRPARQEDWEEASKTGKLPEVSNISNSRLPTLFRTMLFAADVKAHPAMEKLRAEIVARFLLPALLHSQAEHRKWVTLFLAKHNAKLTVDDLPPTPITSQVWRMLILKYPDLIPQRVLEDFNGYIILGISPPATLNDFNKLLREDDDLCGTLEVEHWLSVFGESMDKYNYWCGTQILLELIHHSRPITSLRNGITFDLVFEMVTAHALLFLDEYENHKDIWNEFANDLRPPTKATHKYDDTDSIRSMVLAWQGTGRLVLEKVAALLLCQKRRLRQRKFRQSLKSMSGGSVLEKVSALVLDENLVPEPKGRVFPSATKLLLWLLPYPCFPEAVNIDQQCEAFAKSLVELVESLLTGDVNVLGWPKIAEDTFTVSEMLNTDSERLHVAFYIGGVIESSGGSRDQRNSALNLVRVVLAMKLIEDGRKGLKKDTRDLPPDHLILRLEKRIEQWKGSSDEAIQEKVTEWMWNKVNIWDDPIGSDSDTNNGE